MKHLLLFCTALLVSIIAVAQWVPVGSPGFSTGFAGYTSFAIDNGVPYVAFEDGDNDNKATVMKFNGTAWETVGNPGFSAGGSWYISIAVYNGVPYVACLDFGIDIKANVFKYDGAAWVQVGTPGFSGAAAPYNSLTIYNGEPYLAYADENSQNKATVMKYDGTAWVPVGSPGFSAEGGARFTSLVIDNGIPYVAYRDDGNDGKATVMKYDGTVWMPVGNAGFSAGTADFTSLAVYDGSPYVAYKDGGNEGKITVMKYDGTAWVPLGNPGFSAGAAGFSSLSLGIYNGVPLVAYNDESTGYRATVMKYDGTAWVPVGSPGFSTGTADFESLVIHNGVPYVAYKDAATGNRATVMAYDTVTTASLGGTYCLGTSLNVSYTATGYFSNNNGFTAQLSDASGSFATPVTIGTGTSATSGSIQATIPSNITPGTGYRIRVVSSNPSLSGSDNGQNLTVSPCTCQNATNLSTTNITSASAQLNWNAMVNPQQWQVQYKTIAAGSKWIDVLLTGNLRSATISSLKANQTYNWHIRTKCGGKWTDYTTSLTFKTQGSSSSSIVSSMVAAGDSTITLYPNPTGGRFTVELNLAEKINANVKILLTDVTGKTVHRENADIHNGSLKKTVNIASTLTEGIYVVRIVINDRMYTTKIVYRK